MSEQATSSTSLPTCRTARRTLGTRPCSMFSHGLHRRTSRSRSSSRAAVLLWFCAGADGSSGSPTQPLP